MNKWIVKNWKNTMATWSSGSRTTKTVLKARMVVEYPNAWNLACVPLVVWGVLPGKVWLQMCILECFQFEFSPNMTLENATWNAFCRNDCTFFEDYDTLTHFEYQGRLAVTGRDRRYAQDWLLAMTRTPCMLHVRFLLSILLEHKKLLLNQLTGLALSTTAYRT